MSTAVGLVYQMLVTCCISKKLSGNIVKGIAVCSEGKTEAFHTFECIFKVQKSRRLLCP
jgi:hypothetical protein